MIRSTKTSPSLRYALPALAAFLAGTAVLALAGTLSWPAVLALGLGLGIMAAAWAGLANRPPARLIEALRTLGRGDFNARLSETEDQTPAEVAQAFNEAVARLKAGHEDLARAEKSYRTMFERSMQGFFQTTEDGAFIHANQALADILGYDSPESLMEEVTDIPAQIYANPRRREHILEICRRGEDVRGFEAEYMRRDGTQGWGEVHVRPVPALSGKPMMFEGVLTDITERKLAETALTSSEEQYRSLVENLKIGIYRSSLDAEGRFLYANMAAARIFGYDSAEELMAVPVGDLYQDRGGRGHFLDEVMKSGIIEDRRLEALKKDGSKVLVSDTATLHFGPDGEPDWLEGVIEDVTERGRMEKLEREKSAAELAQQRSNRFLACVSHEIRTPMNAIMGMVELLQETKPTEEQKEYLEVCLGAGEQLMELISEVLDLRTLEAGDVSLHHVPFDLEKLVDETCDALGHRILDRDIAFHRGVADSAKGMWTGDPRRLRQILVHLVGNALKFTEKGRVEVEVSAGDNGEGTPLSIRVRDTGIGIPEDMRENIFESFYQVDATNTRRHGGTGMGLTICRHLVDLMGGRIDLDSTPGRGSEFTVTLPLKKAGAGEETPHPTATKPVRLLLMEDVENNRLLIKYFLKDTRFQVDTAVNGREGVEMFKAEPYDLVIADIMMPVMDGYEATRAIRAWEKEQGLAAAPIIAVTAKAYPEDESKCLEAGCTSYEIKPLKRSKLMELLERHAA